MHYNHFTISYIECLEKHLKITTLDNNDTLFFPDYITKQDIDNLKSDLDIIWYSSQTSIDIISEKKEAKLQAGLFGLVENFDLAIKTGYLLADRIVVLDFIYQRILKNTDQVNKINLGEVGRNLVKMKSLAQEGRFVIIPSPFDWNSDTKIFIQEAANKYDLTIDVISLLNILSISKKCNLQPYTIAENDKDFDVLINENIDLTSLSTPSTSLSSYNSILAGLMTQKVLNIEELQYIKNLPIQKYVSQIIESNNFYNEYSRLITHNGAMNFENNFEELRTEIISSVKKENFSRTKKIVDKLNKASGVATAGISVMATVTVISAPILMGAAAITLGSAIAGLLISSDQNESIVISVLKKLNSN